MLIRRLARPMLATVLVTSGVDTLRNPAPRVATAAPIVAKGAHALPSTTPNHLTTNHLTADADTLVKVSAVVQVVGGVLLASGKHPRLAALALAGSIVPTTLARHAFWTETDPAAKAAQRTHFLGNLSLLGGLLIAAVDTEGKPSLGWRARRNAAHVQQVLAAALPAAASPGASSGALRMAANAVAVSGHDLAHTAAERGSTLAAELAGLAQERAGVLAEQGTRRGRALAARARKQADRARKQAARARKQADRRGAATLDRVQELAHTYR